MGEPLRYYFAEGYECQSSCEMVQNSDGDYIKYADYQTERDALQEQLKQAEERGRELEEEAEWLEKEIKEHNFDLWQAIMKDLQKFRDSKKDKIK